MIKKTKNKSRVAGFTLIEFVVILVVFAIVAGVTLFNFKSFTSRTRIENLAQNIALAVREAQVLGSTRTALQINSGDLQADPTLLSSVGYVGVYIPYTSGGFGHPSVPLPSGESLENGFVVFNDIDSSLTINDGDIVQDVLKLDAIDSISEISAGGDIDVQQSITEDFYILFKRPALTAFMYSGDDPTSNQYNFATITVSTNSGLTKRIQITAGGQISVLE